MSFLTGRSLITRGLHLQSATQTMRTHDPSLNPVGDPSERLVQALAPIRMRRFSSCKYTESLNRSFDIVAEFKQLGMMSSYLEGS
jgi:hypothetical protein